MNRSVLIPFLILLVIFLACAGSEPTSTLGPMVTLPTITPTIPPMATPAPTLTSTPAKVGR